MAFEPQAFKSALLAEARRRGFSLAGIAPATPAETQTAYREWLDSGYAADMHYLARDPDRRSDPTLAWPETASILVVALNYRTREPEAPHAPLQGRFARYALGDDYHEVMTEKLRSLLEWAQADFGPGLRGRCYVDTGPLLERDLAARAGLGWFGKNTCLIHRHEGSYFFLGALLLNVELTPDSPTTAHCGRCTRCLDVCPTGAFVAPYVLDARRCISYLTIELRGPIPRELRPMVGNWVFGCDLCQEACPWNRKAPLGTEERFAAREPLTQPRLLELLDLTQEEFSSMFRRSAVKRARRRGLLRNVCVALGNSGDASAIPALAGALRHEEPLVRGHAAWALGRLGGPEAASALRDRLDDEDPWVRDEVKEALAEADARQEAAGPRDSSRRRGALRKSL